MSNNPSILLTNISTFLLGTHPILPRFFHAPWFCLREFQGNRRTKVLTHAKAATPQKYLVNFLYNNWSWLITQLYLILGTTILDYTYILRWNAVPLLRWSSRTFRVAASSHHASEHGACQRPWQHGRCDARRPRGCKCREVSLVCCWKWPI